MTPWTVACQASLSMGISRQEYWSGLPYPPSGWIHKDNAVEREWEIQEHWQNSMVWCGKQKGSPEKEGNNSGGGTWGLEGENQGWPPLLYLQDILGVGLWGLIDLDNGRTSGWHLWVNVWPGTLSEWGRRPTRSVSLESGLYLYFGTIGGHLASLSLHFLSVKWDNNSVSCLGSLPGSMRQRTGSIWKHTQRFCISQCQHRTEPAVESPHQGISQPGWSGTGERRGCGLSQFLYIS